MSPNKILYLITVVLSCSTVVAGCSSSSGTKSYKLGTFYVRLSGTSLSVADQYGRSILPGSANSTVVFGTGTPSVREQFGSFAITETASWARTNAFRVLSAGPDQLVVQISSSAGDGIMTMMPVSDNLLGISISEPSGTTADLPINRIMLNFSCSNSDHFYGLGEQYNSFDQKGNIVGIWAQDHGFLQDVPVASNFQAALHPTYFPEPFLLMNKPAGILISSTAYSRFDLCASDPKQASIELWDKNMDIVLISDTDPIHIIQDFTGIVGRQPLSPPWVIGPWIIASGGSSSVLNTASQLRQNHVPASAVWYTDWVGSYENSSGNGYQEPYHWTPDFSLYPDMAGMNMTLNSMGFKALAYFNTFVDSSLDQWNAAVSSGYLITQTAGEPYTFTGTSFTPYSMVDLTDPSAMAWVQGYLNNAIGLGFSGWMADFGEWTPYDAYLEAGTGDVFHNEYPVLWAKTNYELMSSVIPSGDFVFFMRSGYLGSQPYQPVVWSGDQNTDFDPQFGLPTVITSSLNMGVSGVPMFTNEIAGYASLACPASTKELFFRWTELNCFTPLMRTTDGYASSVNWSWNSSADTTQMFRTYATLHVELFPYIYTYIEQAHENGTPIMQALWLKYYDDPKTATIDDEYLFGDELLVAPVITQGATSRTLYLPQGNWYPFGGGSAVAGGISITAQAPTDTIPVFAPAGSVIPMLTQAPDTMITGTTVTVTTVADIITAQTLRVYPGADGCFTVYDGSTFSLTSSAEGLNPGNGVVLTDQNGNVLQPCASEDTNVVACGMISGKAFSINGSIGGSSIFTLQGTSSNPATNYRIEVF